MVLRAREMGAASRMIAHRRVSDATPRPALAPTGGPTGKAAPSRPISGWPPRDRPSGPSAIRIKEFALGRSSPCLWRFATMRIGRAPAGRARHDLLPTGDCSDPQPLSNSRVDDEDHRLGGAGRDPSRRPYPFQTAWRRLQAAPRAQKTHRAVPRRTAARDGAMGTERLRRPNKHCRQARKRKGGRRTARPPLMPLAAGSRWRRRPPPGLRGGRRRRPPRPRRRSDIRVPQPSAHAP